MSGFKYFWVNYLFYSIHNITKYKFNMISNSEAIKFYKLIESKNIKSYDINNIISLMNKYRTTQELYDYINKNTKSFFKNKPKSEKRISYLISDI